VVGERRYNMSKFVGYFIKVSEGKYIPQLVSENPNTLSEDELQMGFVTDSFPVIEETAGNAAILYCNPDTKDVWYEYVEVPKTPEQLNAIELENLATYSLDLDFRLSKLELGL
jgi:hypothetical protein